MFVVFVFFTARLLAQYGCADFSPVMFVDSLDLNTFHGSSCSSVHLWPVLYVTYVQLAFHDLSCVASVSCGPMEAVCVCVCVQVAVPDSLRGRQRLLCQHRTVSGDPIALAPALST